MNRNDENLARGLEPMFKFMSKHGIPENFPPNFTTETSLFAKCGLTFMTKSEAVMYKMSSYW